MTDPTTTTDLTAPPNWNDTDPGVDLHFATRAATYLADQGLDAQAVAQALQVELGLTASDATVLAGVPLASPRPAIDGPGDQSCGRSGWTKPESPWRGSRPTTQITSNLATIAN